MDLTAKVKSLSEIVKRQQAVIKAQKSQLDHQQDLFAKAFAATRYGMVFKRIKDGLEQNGARLTEDVYSSTILGDALFAHIPPEQKLDTINKTLMDNGLTPWTLDQLNNKMIALRTKKNREKMTADELKRDKDAKAKRKTELRTANFNRLKKKIEQDFAGKGITLTDDELITRAKKAEKAAKAAASARHAERLRERAEAQEIERQKAERLELENIAAGHTAKRENKVIARAPGFDQQQLADARRKK
jgi:hypothetical protein